MDSLGLGQLQGERDPCQTPCLDFLTFQSLPIKYYIMLKHRRLEDREDAYFWIVFQANIPDAGLSLPEPGKERDFPKFMYDKLGTKPMKRVVATHSPKRSASYHAGRSIFPRPPETGTLGSIICHQSTLQILMPFFGEDFDANTRQSILNRTMTCSGPEISRKA